MNGQDIDVDKVAYLIDAWQQACNVSNNPFIAAQFFHVYIRSFITHLLGCRFDPCRHVGGILNTLQLC